MSKRLAVALAKQRRFKKLLVGLSIVSLVLGLMVVPVEVQDPEANITTFGDGVWWSITTITSVGYGDKVPVTGVGKLIGVVLQLIGVLAFGLLISLVTVALTDSKERFYWGRLFERLDEMESKMIKMEKREGLVMKQVVEKRKVRSWMISCQLV